jgi:hypothetical protein
MSKCLEFGASLPSADFLLLRTERLICVNIQGNSQSRVTPIQLMAIFSLSDLVKSPSSSCNEAATVTIRLRDIIPALPPHFYFFHNILCSVRFGRALVSVALCLIWAMGSVPFRDSPMPLFRTRLTRISEWPWLKRTKTGRRAENSPSPTI